MGKIRYYDEELNKAELGEAVYSFDGKEIEIIFDGYFTEEHGYPKITLEELENLYKKFCKIGKNV